jgi:hypothetical protein
MAKTLSSKIKKKIEDVVEEKAVPIAEKIALDARDKIGRYYLDIIAKFYSTYDPKIYNRHFSERYEDRYLKEEGLGRSFTYLYENRKRDRGYYIGGIHIYPDLMEDYEEPQEQVLNSFLAGWRGSKYWTGNFPHRSGVNPLLDILRYKQKLVKDYNNNII